MPTIRDAQLGDFPAIHHVHSLVFSPPQEAALVDALRHNDSGQKLKALFGWSSMYKGAVVYRTAAQARVVRPEDGWGLVLSLLESVHRVPWEHDLFIS